MALKIPLSVAVCVSFALASCGGGGGVAPSNPDNAGQDADRDGAPGSTDGRAGGLGPGATGQEVGSSTSNEPVGSVRSRALSIGNQANSLFVLSINTQSTIPGMNEENVEFECMRTSCPNEDGENAIDEFRSHFFRTENLEPVATEYGITLVESRVTAADGVRTRGVAGVLKRSVFGASESTGAVTVVPGPPVAVPGQPVAVPGPVTQSAFAASETTFAASEPEVDVQYTETSRGGWVFGDLAGTRPRVSGFWRGTMAGISQDDGHFLRGDVRLSYWISNAEGTLSAEFDDVRAVDGTLTASDLRFQYEDVEVNSDGTFSQGDESNGIQGGFYGSGGLEISGTFHNDSNDIRGAFGALKDECVLQGSEIVCSIGGRLSTRGTPAETRQTAYARGKGIASRTDFFVSTRVRDIRKVFDRAPSFVDLECSSGTCAWPSGHVVEPDSEVTAWFSDAGAARAILTERDITLFQSVVVNSEMENTEWSFFGVLDNSAFVVEKFEAVRQDDDGRRYDQVYRWGRAFGDASGTRPDTSGVWRGKLVGITPGLGDFLEGDADLTYTVSGSGGALSADFTGITNMSRNSAHHTPSVRFSNIDVESSGSFSKSDQNNVIEGSFFGSGGEEVAGSFETPSMFGAFGTSRSN